jgi:adenylate cyclase
MAGHAIARMAGEVEAGMALIDRALALNPNLAAAWLSGGWLKVWLGEPDKAISSFAHAMRLSPIDPHLFNMLAGTASAHLIADRYDQARVWAEMALQDNPDHQPGLRIAAASNAMAGRPEQARQAAARLQQLNPALRVSTLKDVVGPYRRAEDISRLEEGLRQAGLPE